MSLLVVTKASPIVITAKVIVNKYYFLFLYVDIKIRKSCYRQGKIFAKYCVELHKGVRITSFLLLVLFGSPLLYLTVVLLSILSTSIMAGWPDLPYIIHPTKDLKQVASGRLTLKFIVIKNPNLR